MHKEDNVVFVLQKTAEFLKFKVTRKTVKEFLLSHPYYPSLKSVCDALNKWDIENYPLKLEQEEIKALQKPFIAHLKKGGEYLAFVEEIKNDQVTYFISENKGTTEKFEDFAKKLSGAVVVMQASESSGEKEYRQKRQNEILNKSLLPFGVITLAIMAIFNFVSGFSSENISFYTGFLFFGLVLTKIAGLITSIFLVLHELKISVPIADKICNFNSKTDCDTVLSSNASKVFGWLNWADAGLIYFTGTLFFLIGTGGLWPLAVISLFALPYPVFSIYYQAFKAKKWCPFCLLVQLVLITEFILLLPVLYQVHFTFFVFLKLAVTFLIPLSIWLILKAYYNISKEKSKEHYLYLQFKRNPDVFIHLLTKNGISKIEIAQNNMVLGNPNAPITIVAFLSLYCGPCANAFKQLKGLLDNSQEVKINAIFSVYDNDESKKLINTLYFIYKIEGQEQAIDFLYKWYTMPRQNRKTLYEKQLPDGFDLVETIGKGNKQLFEKYKIPGTPTVFVNGYRYPMQQYNYSDIEHYIDDIKQITMESKRKEACANCN